MKKNMSKVLSVMCSVAVFSGMLGMSSVNAGGAFSKKAHSDTSAHTPEGAEEQQLPHDVSTPTPTSTPSLSDYSLSKTDNENDNSQIYATETMLQSGLDDDLSSDSSEPISFGAPGYSREDKAVIVQRVQAACTRALCCLLRGTDIDGEVGGYFDSWRMFAVFQEILDFMRVHRDEMSFNEARRERFNILYDFVDSLLREFDVEESEDYDTLYGRVDDFKERFYSIQE